MKQTMFATAVFLIYLMGATGACEKKGDSARASDPPPISSGKCVVDQYYADRAITQICNYGGYSWSCRFLPGTWTNTCDRLGEAVGERPGKGTIIHGAIK